MEMKITNYISGCIILKFYRKNLNIMCNQILKLFLQVHDKESILER